MPLRLSRRRYHWAGDGSPHPDTFEKIHNIDAGAERLASIRILRSISTLSSIREWRADAGAILVQPCTARMDARTERAPPARQRRSPGAPFEPDSTSWAAGSTKGETQWLTRDRRLIASASSKCRLTSS